MSLLRRCLPILLAALHVSCSSEPKKNLSPQSRRIAERWRLDVRREATPKAILGRREVLIDVSFATAVIDEAYGGRAFVPDADKLLARFAIRSLSRSRGGWDASTLCERIDGALALLPDDQFYASLSGQPCSQARRDRLSEPGGVGANVATRGEVPWALIDVETSTGRTPVLALTNFPPREAKSWDGFDENIERLKAIGTSALIVDLRGNPGGFESGAERIAAKIFGTDEPPVFAAAIMLTRTLPALAALMNASWVRARQPQPELSAARDFSAIKSKYLLSRKNTGEATIRQPQTGPAEPSNSGWRGPILILVDRGCASVCERFALRLARHPRAKLIGEPTAGSARLTDVGLVRLPKSGIEIFVPTAVYLDDEQGSLERVGIPVQIGVPQGNDALQFARDSLSQLQL